MSVLFIDIETTGLDPRVHVPWEVAAVEPDGTEHVWCWRPGLDRLVAADDYALRVGRFDERAPEMADFDAQAAAAEQVAELVEGNVIVGSKPSFDMEMLTAWLRFWGFEPGWHHRPVCVATMATGWLVAKADEWARRSDGDDRQIMHAQELRDVATDLPWRSDDLSRACGVDPDAFDRHTALGDARWVARWYRALTGGSA